MRNREERLCIAISLYKKEHIHPVSGFEIRTMSDCTRKYIKIHVETLVEIEDIFIICSDGYELSASSLDRFNESFSHADKRFQEKVEVLKQYFIVNDESKDFWFTKEELENGI